MPDVLDAPCARPVPPQLRPFAFDKAKATAASKLAHAARWSRYISAAPTKELPPVAANDQAVAAQLRLVTEQLKRTRDVLNDDKYCYCDKCERGGIEPHHRAQLLKALDTLLDRQRVLLGIPLPGSRRPSSERQDRRPIIQLGPVGVAGQVADVTREAAPAGPRPYAGEYDDPPGFVRETPPNLSTGL